MSSFTKFSFPQHNALRSVYEALWLLQQRPSSFQVTAAGKKHGDTSFGVYDGMQNVSTFLDGVKDLRIPGPYVAIYWQTLHC